MVSCSGHSGGGAIIRTANKSDEPAVRRCAERAYERYIAAIGRKPAPMVADFETQIEAGLIHAAFDANGLLLGFIVFLPKDNHMFLENVAVDPSAAGAGVGKALIRYCEETARREGLGSVRLYTNEKMIENLAIYPHLGFVETERRSEDGFNRVYFEKRLV
ncbi:GNAT family N-acetyltransferase [Roseibium sp. SCPC15]|uniref:GNAT family N-acetyltransferase n=1 Tax=Roseibium sp. SCP15 TaxID=3141376 RepID=UPI0033374D66